MRSNTILPTALCAALLLGCEGSPPASWAVTTLVAPGPFHGIHGLGYDRDGRLLAGSVVGAATSAVDRDSGAVTVALPAPDGMADDLALAPDGTLAWTGFLSGTLWIQRPGEAPQRIAAGYPGANSLAFADDGRLFFTQVFLGDALYEADLSGAEAPRLIMEGMGGLNGFENGPDGALYGPLWFKGQIARVDLETETLSVIAEGFAIPAAVNFDSQGRLFTVDTQKGEVLEVNRDGGPHRLIATVAPAIDNLVITPDDQIIISNMADNALIEIDPDSGATRTIVSSALAVAGDIAATEAGDGAWIADVFSLRRVDGKGTVTEVARQYAGALENPLSVGAGAGEIATSSWSAGVIQRFDATSGAILGTYHGMASPMDVLPLGGEAVLFLDFLGGRLVEAKGAHLENQRVILGDLAGPVALLRDDAEHVLISERGAGQVRRVNLADGRATVVAEGLQAPEGLTRTLDGTLLIADVDQRAVFAVEGGKLRTIAEDLPIGFEAPPGTPAAFIPTGLATLGDGSVLLSADQNASVLRLTPP